jgi:DNA polymerase II small subunit/DNA polymerase delta subunit B
MNEIRKIKLLRYWNNISNETKEQVFLALMNDYHLNKEFIEKQVEEFALLFTITNNNDIEEE